MAVTRTLKEVNPVVQGLHGLTVLLSVQETALSNLILQVRKLATVEGPLAPAMIEVKKQPYRYFAEGCFAVSYANAAGFFNDLGVRVTPYSLVPNRTRSARSPVRRPGRCCEQKKGT
jgi:hypothetical protein